LAPRHVGAEGDLGEGDVDEYILCTCGKRCKGRRGLASHKRYCNADPNENAQQAGPSCVVPPAPIPCSLAAAGGPTDESGDYLCPHCDRDFQTKIGLGVHIHSSHREISNARIDVERKRARWNEEEVGILISREYEIRKADPSLGPVAIARLLHETQGPVRYPRSEDSYRLRMRDQLYKAQYKEYAAKLDEHFRNLELGIEADEGGAAATEEEVEVLPVEGLGEQTPGSDEEGNGPREWLEEYLLTPCGDKFKESVLREVIRGSLDDSNQCHTLLEGYLRQIFPSASPSLNRDRPRGAKGKGGGTTQRPNKPKRGGSTLRSKAKSSGGVCEKTKPQSHDTSNQPTQPRPNRAQRLRTEYAAVQEKYKKDRAKLAKLICSDDPLTFGASSKTGLEGIPQAWARIFTEIPEGLSTSNMRRRDKPYEPGVWSAVTSDTVKVALAGFGKDKAKGPDGVSPRLLRSMPLKVIAGIFNLFLLSEGLPPSLKRSKTVLIPKVDKPQAYNDFRPISLSSVIVRLFHRIIATRLRTAMSHDVRQRGFIAADGCGENVMVVNAMIKACYRMCRSGYLTSLDIKNAFGAVSHEAILRAVELSGAPPSLVTYIRNLYTDFVTEIIFEGDSVMTTVKSGTLQGCGLSPHIFNCVMNQVLSLLPTRVGQRVGGGTELVTVNGLAFADDTILASRTDSGMMLLLSTLDDNVGQWGIKFNAKKCQYLALEASGREKKVKVCYDKVFTIGGDRIPPLKIGESLRYLGAHYDPKGLIAKKSKITHYLDRLIKVRLKPQQKLYLLQVHILPKLIHSLVMAPMRVGELKNLDRLVRKYVRRITHLPGSTPLAFFYAPVKDGGLGMMSFRVSIPVMILRRFERMKSSDSPITRAAAWDLDNQRRLFFANEYAVLDDGIRVDSPERVQVYWANKLHTAIDGKSLKQAGEVPYIHSWVNDGTTLLTGETFVEALKVRINALPSLSRTGRGRPTPRECRAGCRAPETNSHVLQNCVRTHEHRITRHNRVANQLQGHLSQKGFEVYVEKKLTSDEGVVLKPDLIAVDKRRRAYVVDFQVVGVYDTLDRLNSDKISKYDIPWVKERVSEIPGVDSVKVMAATFTYHGLMARRSAKDLLDLGVTKKMLKLLAVTAIEGSVYSWHYFRKCTAWSWKKTRRRDLQSGAGQGPP